MVCSGVHAADAENAAGTAKAKKATTAGSDNIFSNPKALLQGFILTPIFEIGCFHKNPAESFMQTLVRFAMLCYTVFSEEVRHAANRTNVYRH